VLGREQRTEIRGQTRHRRPASIPSAEPRATCPPGRAWLFAPPRLTPRRTAYPCPGRSHHRRLRPASRSRLASRCPENRGQRSENRPDGSIRTDLRPTNSWSRRQRTRQRPAPSAW